MRMFQVDAFTEVAFKGNPAAVCLIEKSAPDAWMQALAAENNLAETAFVLEAENGFDLRWFTPACEVSLCGHATLASAHVLWETGALGANDEAVFHTASGDLTAARRDGWIEMNFPSKRLEPAALPAKERAGLVDAFGSKPAEIFACEGLLFLLYATGDLVTGLAPDFAALMRLDADFFLATAPPLSESHDFVSRFFAPSVGIDEDPATGSAHCYLAPFWSERLGKTDLTGYQASARGGIVRCRPDGDRVKLTGKAVTVFTAELTEAALRPKRCVSAVRPE